MIKEDLVKI